MASISERGKLRFDRRLGQLLAVYRELGLSPDLLTFTESDWGEEAWVTARHHGRNCTSWLTHLIITT